MQLLAFTNDIMLERIYQVKKKEKVKQAFQNLKIKFQLFKELNKKILKRKLSSFKFIFFQIFHSLAQEVIYY